MTRLTPRAHQETPGRRRPAQRRVPRDVSYTIVLQPAAEGGYIVFVPALPGCYTQGDTLEEAIAMARDAIALYVDAVTSGGEDPPAELGPIQTLTLSVPI